MKKVKEKIKKMLINTFIYPSLIIIKHIVNGEPAMIKQTLHQWKWRARSCTFGDKHPDKTFFVIRWDSYNSALMGLFVYVLSKIKYAKEKGWVPIVDFQNGKNCYFNSETEVGLYNPWEKFFRQITPYTLDEVYQSNSVEMSSIDLQDLSPFNDEKIFELTDSYSQWKQLSDKYIRLSPEVTQLVKRLNEKFGETANAIAVKVRGSDYINPPKGHCYQPSIETVIEAIYELQRKTGADKVFLATEDKNVEKEIVENFESEIIVVTNELQNLQVKDNETESIVAAGQRYLAELAFLAQCPYLIGGMNGGLIGIMLLAPDLKELKTWDLGKAP